MPNHHLSCGAQDHQIPAASDGVPWCECDDPDVAALGALISMGVSQRDASLWLWHGGPRTGAEMALLVRARLLVAVPWLRLPDAA